MQSPFGVYKPEIRLNRDRSFAKDFIREVQAIEIVRRLSLFVIVIFSITSVGCETLNDRSASSSSKPAAMSLRWVNETHPIKEANKEARNVENRLQPIDVSSEAVGQSVQPIDASSVADNENVALPESDNLLYEQFGDLNRSSLMGESLSDGRPDSLWQRISGDHRRFYSTNSLVALGVAVGAGAAVANTQLDAQIQNHFRSSVINASSEEWFEKLHSSKELGNGYYSVPIFAAAWGTGFLIDDSSWAKPLSSWGERSIRGFAVGALPVVAMQRLTGGSRPGETASGSDWHMLRDNNGVSGHAFMASLPFITAAKMSDNMAVKSLCYAGSFLGPLSRMNDNAHYPSQIALGWVFAFAAASAVDRDSTFINGWSLVPSSTGFGSGLAAEYNW